MKERALLLTASLLDNANKEESNSNEKLVLRHTESLSETK